MPQRSAWSSSFDGATARTATGCVHGVAWYAAKLGAAITNLAADSDLTLTDVVREAIARTAEQHSQCDLSHPGTPSAMIGVVRIDADRLEYLVLGDTTILVDTWEKLHVVTDNRVSATAQAERAEADRHPFGSPQKQAALLRMKHAELAQRNQPGGFWTAAADPAVASHAITGSVRTRSIRRLAVMTDGAARISTTFNLVDWHGALELMEEEGPSELIRRVRALESADPTGSKWPRNKASDDATAVMATL